MFKLNVSNTFKYPVKFTVIDETGRQISHEIKAVFKRLSNTAFQDLLAANQDRLNERRQNADAGVITPAGDILDNEVDFIMQFTNGWEGVADENGAPLEFNAGAVKTVLDAVPNLGGELMLAFVTAHNGGQKRKN